MPAYKDKAKGTWYASFYYHELFDEALERYNAKQTRADRRIEDYYEKIRSGKQEKPFHEIILQVGNRDDMSADSEEGQLAAAVLDEYMKGFQERNPQLRVFSAHLHMDEATPHLHIDFVPFTTGSKRGLDTRVSLKQALAAQGFKGGTRGDTEWSQWVRSEKERLSLVMERHGIEWEDKGTHDKHLSVLDYKKEQRAKEIAVLDTVKAEKESLGREPGTAAQRTGPGGKEHGAVGCGLLRRPGRDFAGAGNAGNRPGLPGEKGQTPVGPNRQGAALPVSGLCGAAREI